ncbi:hypothetical protein [Phytoactinopolyspora halotolerans]|uniref:hypothetical protein n=1 Tax=Phytoactinopolyspora halotolerans TaxID=1981512 RepID=UPI001FE33B3D|nr:hypothetical protein [Phytoactinopolyspora halotolerans]
MDGRDLNEPDELRGAHLRLPAGGWYDLAFTMPEHTVALVFDNDHDSGVRLLPSASDDDEDAAAQTAAMAEDTSDWPELDLLSYGWPAPAPFGADGPFDCDFTVVDRSLETHRWHLHGHTVHVLSRDSEQGMMLGLGYDGVTSPFHGSHAP